MTSIFGQVWLWSLLAFVLGVLITWALLVRPAQQRLSRLETDRESGPELDHAVDTDQPDEFAGRSPQRAASVQRDFDGEDLLAGIRGTTPNPTSRQPMPETYEELWDNSPAPSPQTRHLPSRPAEPPRRPEPTRSDFFADQHADRTPARPDAQQRGNLDDSRRDRGPGPLDQYQGPTAQRREQRPEAQADQTAVIDTGSFFPQADARRADPTAKPARPERGFDGPSSTKAGPGRRDETIGWPDEMGDAEPAADSRPQDASVADLLSESDPDTWRGSEPEGLARPEQHPRRNLPAADVADDPAQADGLDGAWPQSEQRSGSSLEDVDADQHPMAQPTPGSDATSWVGDVAEPRTDFFRRSDLSATEEPADQVAAAEFPTEDTPAEDQAGDEHPVGEHEWPDQQVVTPPEPEPGAASELPKRKPSTAKRGDRTPGPLAISARPESLPDADQDAAAVQDGGLPAAPVERSNLASGWPVRDTAASGAATPTQQPVSMFEPAIDPVEEHVEEAAEESSVGTDHGRVDAVQSTTEQGEQTAMIPIVSISDDEGPAGSADQGRTPAEPAQPAEDQADRRRTAGGIPHVADRATARPASAALARRTDPLDDLELGDATPSAADAADAEDTGGERSRSLFEPVLEADNVAPGPAPSGGAAEFVWFAGRGQAGSQAGPPPRPALPAGSIPAIAQPVMPTPSSSPGREPWIPIQDLEGNRLDAATLTPKGAQPFGPGSAPAAPDGSAPTADYQIKANAKSRTYYTEQSPQFATAKAQVWFRSEADAQRAGFAPWHTRRSGSTGH
ncbi:sunset domain-containing protein [Actinoalloteichus hymeniacidonis]|uniref:Membrane protein ArfC n=1 Tax=Actinoalloteichus hymeniacidonis TaxID=340345 RepID=A0AAC9HLG8_9PSEU|nr:hypothetical protein [Actinoalloteichus hymeniacidonis]AOS61375.1 hypothetical protein TL08_02685 [Actinoalloteichus hymeniacidonis]MBB5910620.1 hypothetical protein [Actinoalloteichus hymeniacidonis]